MGVERDERRDVYYRLAKKQGYRARSVYKLLQIDEVYGIFANISKVVDLCAAPGSWTQYAMRRICANGMTPLVVSVDVQDIAPISGVVHLKEDITSQSCVEKIRDILGGQTAELVLCDCAPDITGLRDLDEYLQIELLTSALSLSLNVADVNSSFIGKCLLGGQTGHIIEHFKCFYNEVLLLKPKASRAASSECFIYSRGMKHCDKDPRKLETSSIIRQISIIPCGYGSDPGLEYKAAFDCSEEIKEY